MEKTFSIIKPDAVARNLIGAIVKFFEDNDIKIKAMLMKKLSKEEAQNFYIEHKERPFYGSLVSYMTSGPVVLMVLEGKSVVERNRKMMGATNPLNAEAGTIRKMYAESLERNSVHGSDSPQSAQREINFFFPNL